MLLSGRCGCQARHRSSDLGKKTEFPCLNTLLEPRRSTQLLHLITQQPFEKKHVSQQVLASSDNHHRRALSSEQSSGTIGFHVHMDRHRGHLSWKRPQACLVLHQVSTESPELSHVPTSWLFHVSRKTLHCFREVNHVSSDIFANLITKLRYKVDSSGASFSELSGCPSFLLTSGESTPFAPTTFMVFKSPSTSFVSASKVTSSFLHVNLDRSMQDPQFLRVFCGKPHVPNLFHLKPFP